MGLYMTLAQSPPFEPVLDWLTRSSSRNATVVPLSVIELTSRKSTDLWAVTKANNIVSFKVRPLRQGTK